MERVELKDISLPESMKRSMSRQAEAERERRARVIAADGEYQASTRLAEAATVMSADPAALQLRLLQTVVEVAAEKNSTLVMPFPVELLRFFDNAAPAPGRLQAAADDARAADGSTRKPACPPSPGPARRRRGPDRVPERRLECAGRSAEMRQSGQGSELGQVVSDRLADRQQPRPRLVDRRPGWSSLPFVVKGVQRDRGVCEGAARAHLGGDPDGFHDLLIARAGRRAGSWRGLPGPGLTALTPASLPR